MCRIIGMISRQQHANGPISGLLILINKLAIRSNLPSSARESGARSCFALLLPRNKSGFHFPRERDNADAERASEIEGGGEREGEMGIGTENRKKKEVTPRNLSGAHRGKRSGVEASASSYCEK